MAVYGAKVLNFSTAPTCPFSVRVAFAEFPRTLTDELNSLSLHLTPPLPLFTFFLRPQLAGSFSISLTKCCQNDHLPVMPHPGVRARKKMLAAETSTEGKPTSTDATHGRTKELTSRAPQEPKTFISTLENDV
jgi:hypothetical protein